jgi:hypothetical protein
MIQIFCLLLDVNVIPVQSPQSTMTIAKYQDRRVFSDREAVIKSIARFSNDNDFVTNIEKDVDIVFSKCVIRSCSHYLVFRLQETGWKLVTVDSGHKHSNGISDNRTHIPHGPARPRLPRLTEPISPPRETIPPSLTHQPEPSTVSIVSPDQESASQEYSRNVNAEGDFQVEIGGDFREEEDSDEDGDAQDNCEGALRPEGDQDGRPSQQKLVIDPMSRTPGPTIIAGQFELLPPIILKRWPTPPTYHLPDDLKQWRIRSHRREGHARLMHLRDLYDGKGDGSIPRRGWFLLRDYVADSQ